MIPEATLEDPDVSGLPGIAPDFRSSFIEPLPHVGLSTVRAWRVEV